MKQTELIMGMPITVEIVGASDENIFEKVFDYFRKVDARFSPFKKTSEVSLINSGKISGGDYSLEMREILKLSEQTKKETEGYFDIFGNGKMDPSGIVKGWAINNAAKIISDAGFKNFYVEAGGDIQTSGQRANGKGQKWRVGIRNPFNVKEIVKVLGLSGEGIATSGNYERGEHIYNPRTGKVAKQIASMTVVGLNVYEADRFATAAFAMGKRGMEFIERKKGLEGYMINLQGVATYTSGFEKYLI